MGAAPAFQFYASDFLSGTTFLSAAAVGAYIRMLAQSWEHGPIPDTPMALHKAMGLGPLDPPMEAIWSELSCKWKRTPKGWTNDKLERVRREQIEYRKTQHRAGVASGKRRRELSLERSFNKRSTIVATEPEPEGQPNTQPEPQRKPNPSISDLDLRSSALSLPSQTERANVRPILDGRAIREHGSHEWCSLPREGLCVPAFLHREFVGKLDRVSAETDLRRWYVSVRDRFAGVAIGDDSIRFWRNEFSAWVGTVTSGPVSGKGNQSRDAMQRAIARRAAAQETT